MHEPPSDDPTVDLIEQWFTETSIDEDPIDRLRYLHGENKRLQEKVTGYGASLLVLLGLVLVWGVALMVNRPPPLRLNGCKALDYYLDAGDQASADLPVATRQFLNDKAAACHKEYDDNDGGEG
jgi:hypothetical protein